MNEYELLDVATIKPNTPNNNYSVSQKLVYFGLPKNSDKYAIESVCCVQHGAMLAVARLDDIRMLYRCEVCNNGAVRKKLDKSC